MSKSLNKLVMLLFFIPACINLLPSVGVISNDMLTTLYDIEITSTDLALLMRHRAVLFFIIGLLLLLATFRKHYRWVAGVAGLTSMLSFVALAWMLPSVNASLDRIVVIDLIASALLIAALVMDSRVNTTD